MFEFLPLLHKFSDLLHNLKLLKRLFGAVDNKLKRKKIKEILIELDKEGKVVVLSDQDKSIRHEQFTQMPGLVRIDIYIKEPGQISRLLIKDIGDILKEVEGESA